MGALLHQTIEIGLRSGLIDMRHIAIDGTKIKANASRNKAMSYGRLVKEEERLHKEINEWFEDCDATDRFEDEYYDDSCPDEPAKEMDQRQKRLDAIRKTRAALEEEARAGAEQEQEQRRAQAEA